MIKHYITVISDSESATVEYEPIIKECINETLISESLPFSCEVCVLLTDNAGIRELNNSARGLDKPTDVLSFPMLELHPDTEKTVSKLDIDPDTGLVMLGDIVISVERAMEQASEYNHSLKRELSFLAVHAALHLLGYDHELGEADELRHFGRQKEILRTLKITQQ